VTIGEPITLPSGTLVVNANGTYTFTPTANYTGSVPTITYTVSDGTATATANLNITITPVNDAPVANADLISVAEGTSTNTYNVLTSDSDVDGDALSLTSFTINGITYTAGTTATIPGVGTVVISSAGTVTFVPQTGYNGSVPTITYTVSDGNGGTATSTLNITVSPVNDPPVALTDNVTGTEDTPVSGNVLTNDSDLDSGTLTVTAVTIAGVSTPVTIGQPITLPSGTLVVNANGTYTFTPTANYNGSVPTITYTVSDGTATATANLNITINPANDAPDAVNDVATATEDQPLTTNVLANDIDVDGDALTLTTFTINGTTYPAGSTAAIPGVGTVVISSTGTVTFTPEANYNGAVPSITYEVSDGKGGTDTGVLSITVSPVNDAPVALTDNVTGTEDTPVSGNVLTNDSDVDSGTLTVTAVTIAGVSTPVTIGEPITLPSGTLVHTRLRQQQTTMEVCLR
jgi:CshA-type fibril repeat protein